MSKKYAFLFPGQGAQAPGMVKDVAESSKAAKKVIDDFSSVINVDMAELLWNTDADTLSRSDNSQIAITAASLAIMAALKEKGIEQTKPYTYIDENGEEQIVKDTYYIGNKEVEAAPPTEADIDTYIEFLKTADMLVNYNESITDIILEEAQSYFNGQKSADSVAKVIQSRVQIYVNENR